MTSCVQRAASAAPVENSLEVEVAGDGQVVVAGQADVGVLARQAARSRWGRRRSRRCRPGTRSPRRPCPHVGEHRLEGVAVAVDVGDDGDLHGSRGRLAVGHSLRTWNAPAGLPWPWLLPSSLRRRRSCCCGRVTASSTPAPVEPGSYFSAAEIERARDYRHGQLVLFAAGTAIEVALLVLARAPSTRASARPLPAAGARGGGRRRGAVGGVRPRARCRSAPISQPAARSTSGLSTQDWGPWLGDAGQVDGHRRRSSPAPAPRPRWRSCAAFPAGGGCPAASLVVGFARGQHLRWARSSSTRSSTSSRPLPERPHARRRAGPGARGEGRRRPGLRGRRQPAHDGRPTPTSPVWAGPSASSSTTTS